MKNNLRIGITGGIGSGKTVVCRIFKVLGIPVYDADSRARYIINNDQDLRKEIIDLFGEKAYTDNGLNNEWMAGHVFNDEDRLNELNALVHPKVGQDFEAWVKVNKSYPYTLKEAALLFETGSYKVLDKIIVVSAPEALRVERTLERDKHRTLGQVNDILRRQWPEETKIERADYLITNDDNHLVIPQVLALHEKILRLAAS